MGDPAVSVLMPAYNAARYVAEAVASVRAQDLGDWELVAVDDGSADGTRALLEEAAATDDRIRVLPLPHRGLVEALNAGLAACRAPLVARMDADDRMRPARLRRQVEYLDSHPEVGLVGSLIECFPAGEIQEGLQRYQEWLNSLVAHEDIARDLFVESPFAHPSVMLRGEVARAVGGYQDRGWAEDYDLWLRLFLANTRFAKVPEVLHFWRDRPDRLTRTADEYSLRNFRRLKIHYLRQGFLAGRGPVLIWGAGRGGKAWAASLEEAGVAIAGHVDIDPKKIGRTRRGRPVIAPADLPPPGTHPVLVTVGVKGARELIRCDLDGRGHVELRDYVCVA
ncbi:MAG: glycosyltransferase [Armatimonadetes bacterium]|nr:glycosyltransferase [Armatimonadota bacterium]